MIYGLIPIGGGGTRMSLPYSKEMLPQKNFDYFNPVANHTVEKMKAAGATTLVFVHGLEFKQDVKKYFDSKDYLHINQEKLGSASAICDFYNQIKPNDHDVILFGLPDSVSNKNLFTEMINKPNIVCGLFRTNNQTKVDRLNTSGELFQVKSAKHNTNQDWFWGVVKFDGRNIRQMINDSVFDQYSDLGNILNLYSKTMVYGDGYLDLGTWSNYNQYLSE
jgi:glucose-1-phosphate thymidylyltransferase